MEEKQDEIMEKSIQNENEDCIIKTKFYIPEEKKYKYFHLKIAPSQIPNAGMGVYAIDNIPKGAQGLYKGVKKSMTRGNVYYSWVIFEYDTVTGEANTKKGLYLLDASNKNVSNWTRYVNCGMKKRDNNMDSIQKFDKIYYYTTKEVQKGKELFIDYGPGYRKSNLGMKGRY